MNRTLAAFALLFLAASVVAQTTVPVPDNAGGVGDLLVAPTRVILSETTRTAEIALINTGSSPTNYRISVRHLRMKKDGTLEDVETPDGERFADPFVRFTPKQVTLEPRVAQTVRVRAILPNDAEAGEYRLHLEFHGLPPSDLNQGAAGEGQVAIKVVPVYGVTIPLLVRRSPTAAQVTIESLSVERDGDSMTAVFDLCRTGSRSTYGNVTARFIPNGGAEEVVGGMKGISIYVPLDARRVTLPLRAPLRNGVLKVTYVDADATAGAPPLQAHLVLP